ncbi:MAG TPA: hypothetical protein DGH68_09695 [Bacteroidetes bacterium]|nr:hypothetical protein [Bacteroidota bacterium]
MKRLPITRYALLGLLFMTLTGTRACGENPRQDGSGPKESGSSAASQFDSSTTTPASGSSQPASNQDRVRVDIQLRDGSRILGYPEVDSLTLRTEYATLKLALGLLRSIEFADADKPVAASLRSGERLRGILAHESLQVLSILGSLTIPIRDISSLHVFRNISALDSGLVAFYPFRGDASDESGHGYDGTVKGAKLCNDRDGNSNSAYSFDGNDSHISIPDGIVRHDLPAFSISAWLFAPEFDGRRMAVYLGAATGEVQLQIVDRRMTLSTKLVSAWYGVSTNMLFNTWVHVVGVYRRGSSSQLWINGEEKAETPLPPEDLIHLNDAHHSSIGSYSPAYFGYAHSNGIGSWIGSIDQVRIYSRALDPEEIRSLFTSGN